MSTLLKEAVEKAIKEHEKKNKAKEANIASKKEAIEAKEKAIEAKEKEREAEEKEREAEEKERKAKEKEREAEDKVIEAEKKVIEAQDKVIEAATKAREAIAARVVSNKETIAAREANKNAAIEAKNKAKKVEDKKREEIEARKASKASKDELLKISNEEEKQARIERELLKQKEREDAKEIKQYNTDTYSQEMRNLFLNVLSKKHQYGDEPGDITNGESLTDIQKKLQVLIYGFNKTIYNDKMSKVAEEIPTPNDKLDDSRIRYCIDEFYIILEHLTQILEILYGRNIEERLHNKPNYDFYNTTEKLKEKYEAIVKSFYKVLYIIRTEYYSLIHPDGISHLSMIKKHAYILLQGCDLKIKLATPSNLDADQNFID